MSQFPMEKWESAARGVEQILYPTTGKSPLAGNPLAELDPELAELMQVIARGRGYADETIDLKTRALCSVAAFVALGEQSYAQTWITNALTAGATREQIVSLLGQLNPYIGTATLVRGFAAAKAAFAAQGT